MARLSAVVLAMAVARGTAAQAPANTALDDSVRAVASVLRCPVCQGESIQDSPSELARQMRTIVREQLAAGETSDQVKAYFVSKYGDWILLQPRARGVGLAVYGLPVAALLAGALVVVFSVRRWVTPKDGSG